MRFRYIILAYFVIGAMMFGAGLITWQEGGLVGTFVENDASGVSGNEETNEQISETGSTITQLVDAFGGPIIIIWNFVDRVLGFIHWPIVTLANNNAPPRITILLGGGFVVGFYMSLVGLVRSSA